MVVLSEAPADPDREARNPDAAGLTRAARAAGLPVLHLPPEVHLDLDLDPAEAVAALPAAPPGPAYWVGTVPSYPLYQAVYAALEARGLRLLNPPELHRRAEEMQLALPHLAGITPESEVVTALEQVPAAVARLGLPLFVKGSVFSRKDMGWRACVAETAAEAEDLARRLLAMPVAARHHAILRRLAPLRRRAPAVPGTFPGAREYRVFLYRGQPFAHGFYWDDAAEPPLTAAEEAAMLALAREAARRLGVPALTVDLGQLEDGGWIVIEVGDPQFCGLSRVRPGDFWAGLLAALE